MTVGRICCSEVDLVEPGETVHAAAQRMLQRNVGSLVAVDESRRPIGILTDRDLTLRVLAKGLSDETPAREVMTPAPRTVRIDTTVDAALASMREGNVRRLPVVDPEGSLIGILSMNDIVQHIADETEMIRGLLQGESPRALAEP